MKHSSIQPEHNVLEIGFGPGIGIKAAYEVIKGSSLTLENSTYLKSFSA